ncbi:MAG: phosphoenolpyruvate--protein phosphotransferase [Betaproteobacteria bacterium]|nr:phosphoenolpyruvate--protein phosphotransferase [Betaproteobacteria bacterium]
MTRLPKAEAGNEALVSAIVAAPAGASFTLHGAGVSGGIAIGYAHLVSTARLEVARYEIAAADVEEEVRRFNNAVAEVRGELAGLAAAMPPSAPAEMSAFLNLHLMILDDAHLSQLPCTAIRTRRCNAEWALMQQMDLLVQQFDEIQDPYLRERKQDVVQVVERLLKAMMGTGHAPKTPASEETAIVVAHDLSPADMILFKQHHFAGFVTDVGGVTSHSAIVARSLTIPAIVGLHHARDLVREGELLIVDGREGVLIVNPDRRVLAEYEMRSRRMEAERRKLKRLRSMRATTLDGAPIDLQVNIELPQDVEEARDAGATGVGLFRSEYLFLNRDDLPGEDEQFEAYRKVAQMMDGLPVTIRTLDLGADKSVNVADRGGPNPALGLRAIRFCLAEPQMFMTQLRAILRASHYGRVRVLIPMLAHAHEIEQTFAILAHTKATLDQLGVPYDREITIGGMIEIPAAALSLGVFMRRLDFLSIGTNDLIQYTLAIDRTDDTVAHLYDPLHPAVLHLIANTIRKANKAKVPVAVCGEMAGDTAATRLLLGFGLRQFSMHPAQVLAIKEQVLRTRITEVEPVARRILRTDDPDRCLALLQKLNA